MDHLELVLTLISLSLFPLAFFTGFVFRNAHYQRIHEREDATIDQPAVTFRSLPDDRAVESATLARGSVVMSVDYFRHVLSSLKKLVGGELGYYSQMLDRARREALLRMKESVPDADIFVNTRLETTTLIGKGDRPSGVVEIVAYSTAIRFSDR